MLHRIAALAGLALVLGAAPAWSQDRPRIAVFGFENNSTWSHWGDRLGFAAGDEMATQLVQSGVFSVMERQQLQAILDEQHLGASGAVDAETAARLGELLGVQALVMGSITKFSIDTKSGGVGPFSASFSEAESALDVRVVSTTTGEILLVGEGEGTKRFGGAAYTDINFQRTFDQGVAQEALRPAVETAVEALVGQADRLAALEPVRATASVVGSGDAGVYIDRGQDAGVTVGQRFEVLRVVDEIRGADGELLDRITEPVGILEVTRVLSQSAVCTVVEGEAAEGDTVREVADPPA